MKAARLHEYHQPLQLESIDEPKVVGPFDVIVRIGAAGLCRTDRHARKIRRVLVLEIQATGDLVAPLAVRSAPAPRRTRRANSRSCSPGSASQA